MLCFAHSYPTSLCYLQSVHNSITDVPSCVAFLPASVKLLAYSSSLMLGQVLLFDYRAAAVLRTISMPQVPSSSQLPFHSLSSSHVPMWLPPHPTLVHGFIWPASGQLHSASV